MFHDKNVRLRLLSVLEIIKKRSINNPVSVQEIIELINQNNQFMIPVSDRRAIYRDLEAIKESGVPVEVIKRRSNKHFYYCEGL